MNGAAGVRPVRTAAAKNVHGATGGKRKAVGTNGPRRPRWNKPVKPAIVVALVAALALVGVGGVLAWLVSTDSLTNTFGVGKIETSIEETFEDPYTVKSDVKVKNDGNVDAWIRAQVNIYWVDKEGNQLWDEPAENTDYTLVMGGQGVQPTNWLHGQDGYYYYESPIKPGNYTGFLIKELKDTSDYDDGRKLVCDIAAQAIQADPYKAVEEAWDVVVDTSGTDGPTLTLKDGKVVTSTESEVA